MGDNLSESGVSKWLMNRRQLLSAIPAIAPVLASTPVMASEPTTRTLKDVLSYKAPLRLLNDRPINAETPAHMLDDNTTPASHLFVRNNGHIPQVLDVESWKLEVSGESCLRPQSFTLKRLRDLFKTYSYDLQLECGGNGRSEFRPRASGNQWSTGAVGCANWSGVRLKDVLDYCGVHDSAEYIGYKGADLHLSGDSTKTVISRGVPLAKAMEKESLLAFALNGAPIPPVHGVPLRMICGGWPASASGKWLTHLLVRDREHDGAKMGGKSYRVPCESVAPGTEVLDRDMCIIHSMPVKSLITRPRSGITASAGTSLKLGGHAWAGDLEVSTVHVSIDYGTTWQACELSTPVNRLAWQHWQIAIKFPRSGYYEVWARATDELGRTQPMLVPGWNPKGYLNNAAHRIAVHVA